MTTREKILNSLTPILAHPTFVTIDNERITGIAKEFMESPVPSWDNDLQLLGTPEETVQYYLFLDSINFCFWAPKGKTRWEYSINGEWVGGYYAYSKAIKDAFLKDPRLFDAEYLSQIPEEDFGSIFAAGRNELLLMEERLEIIRENFRILREHFDGQALNILKEAGMDADRIVSLLLEHFPSFDDSVDWNGHQIFLLKRAQIFVSDLSFAGLSELTITNLGNLTVFADYKLPQILESFGVLRYSSELDADVVNEILIPAGSQKEVELRASSIAAIEQIRNEIERLGREISTNELDWILWVKAKATTFSKPHHKTLTTFY
ncbi:MAG: queuosine salvage family protein [Minisyncoccia bacterium]